MSQSSNTTERSELSSKIIWPRVVMYPAWVMAVFYGVQAVFGGIKIADGVTVPGLLHVLVLVGVPLGSINPAVLQTVITAIVFTIVLTLVLWLPKVFKKGNVSRKELGLTRLPSWLDIGLGLLALVPYLIISGLLLWLVSKVIMGFDATEKQDIGFNTVLSSQINYFFAFVTLVVVAPLAEETLFRGYLYGKLRRYGIVVAAVVTSLIFAFLHGQWNVALDVFVLSLVLCTLREVTGSIWAGVLLHMTKNMIAYYFLFVVPLLIH